MAFTSVLLIFFSLSFASSCNSLANTKPNPPPPYTNSLIQENSPYLLQHAHNPVNWYAWTKKAFELAKKNNKPIFLSIGYSTCHWCHVMEKESFENVEIAKILNKNFIAIKVDREQRPDVDALYMKSVMMINGQGGWPLNVFITPTGEYFYGASYFPPDKFKQTLLKISSLWQDDQDRLRNMAKSITQLVNAQQNKISSNTSTVMLSKKEIDKTIQGFLVRFDELQGGFSGAPKFPNESVLFFLLDSLSRENNADILTAVTTTLDAMSNGGIYDHIGGGFHRYSIDNSWFTPHFEKMLYNQAHLARVYMQAYQVTGNEEYAEIAKQTINYVLLDMKASDNIGGFYSASDADSKASVDSEAEEGVYFLWRNEELKQTLTEKEFIFLEKLYGVSEQGNFLEAGQGQNILFRYATLSEYAQANKLTLSVVIKQLNQLRQKIYNIRVQRISPQIDKKIVTAWNAMMITTLAQASSIFHNKMYLQQAISVANTINTVNYNKKTKQLLRSSINGKSNVLASQEDYAYFAQALISLYDYTGDSKWLIQSQNILQQMTTLFWDEKNGGFFQNNPLQEVPISQRMKNIYDNAIPSGNSIAYEVLNDLITRTSDQRKVIDYQQLKAKMMAFYAYQIERILAMPYMMMTLQKELLGGSNTTQYGANGHLKITLNKISQLFSIKLEKGWHINSASPIQKNLIKTKIELALSQIKDIQREVQINLENIQYPQATIKELGFSQTKLSLYEDNAKIKFSLRVTNQTKNSSSVMIPIKISYQACSDKICLAPESLIFYLPLIFNNLVF